MRSNVNRLKTQIDFTTLRGNSRSSLIYTALNYYNRGSTTGTTASELILEAYRRYDPSESEEITELRDMQNKAKAFIERYEITSKAEILEAVKRKDVIQSIELDEIKKKFFNFDSEDPSTIEMWNILEGIRYRDRAAVLCRILYQYFAHGNSPFYNELCADRLLAWMKEDYDLVGNYGTERIEDVADIIWRNGVSEEALSKREEETCVADDGDRLRKAMGLI